MILATHQPIFLPWAGFFYKAFKSDCMVLLDDVQYPRGRSWLNRNRLKNEDGELWLTVPIRRKGRGLEAIREVEVYDERAWRRKHLRSIAQNYARAPYLDDYFESIDDIYRANHTQLLDLNIRLIRFFSETLSSETPLLLQSELGAGGTGTDLLVDVCKRVGATHLAIFPGVQKHLDTESLTEHGIMLSHLDFDPPVYPQLWGDFIYNLSILDVLLNCGPKTTSIVLGK